MKEETAFVLVELQSQSRDAVCMAGCAPEQTWLHTRLKCRGAPRRLPSGWSVRETVLEEAGPLRARSLRKKVARREPPGLEQRLSPTLKCKLQGMRLGGVKVTGALGR